MIITFTLAELIEIETGLLDIINGDIGPLENGDAAESAHKKIEYLITVAKLNRGVATIAC